MVVSSSEGTRKKRFGYAGAQLSDTRILFLGSGGMKGVGTWADRKMMLLLEEGLGAREGNRSVSRAEFCKVASIFTSIRSLQFSVCSWQSLPGRDVRRERRAVSERSSWCSHCCSCSSCPRLVITSHKPDLARAVPIQVQARPVPILRSDKIRQDGIRRDERGMKGE